MKRRKKRKPRAAPLPSSGAFAARPEPWIFLAALAVRAVHLWLYRDDFWLKTPLLDDNIFVSWARTIETEGWTARSLGVFDLNPAYPYFLALAQKTIGSGVLRIFALQHAFGAAAAVLFYRLGAELFDRRTGLIAAALAALFGPVVFYESRFLGAFWIFFFNLCFLTALAGARRSQRPWRAWGLAGLAFGCSTVFRPNVLALLPAVLLWGLWSLRTAPRVMALCLGLGALGAWLPLLPFQLRNRAVDPSAGWGLTTSSGGVNLFLGNNPEADGLNRPPAFIRYGPGHEYQDFKAEADRRTGRDLSRKEVSRYWTGEVVDWFMTSPSRAAGLLVQKAGFFWNHKEPPDNFFPAIFRKFTKIGPVPLISWGLIAPLGLAGMLWSLRKPRDRGFWLLHAYVLCYFAVNAAFYILSRYRFPAAVGLIPFAAYALSRLAAYWSERSAGKLAVLGALLLAAFAVSRVPLIGEEDMAVSHYSMGVIYANKGWQDQAVSEYRKSIQTDPSFKASWLNLGILEAKRGRLPEAVQALEGALRLEREPERVRLLQENIARLKAGIKSPVH